MCACVRLCDCAFGSGQVIRLAVTAYGSMEIDRLNKVLSQCSHACVASAQRIKIYMCLFNELTTRYAN